MVCISAVDWETPKRWARTAKSLAECVLNHRVFACRPTYNHFEPYKRHASLGHESEAHEGAECNSVAEVVVLNASPLVLDDVSHRKPLQALASAIPITDLGFMEERQILLQAKQRCGSPVKMDFRHLNVNSLAEVLASCPRLLHISGHGDFTSTGEYIMALEGPTGAADLFSMDRLQSLLSAVRPHLPELVFISCCYSERAAGYFLQSGARHVVACREGFRLMDAAARHFTQHFYFSLFLGHTIQKSFNMAVAAVRVTIDACMTDEQRCGVPSSADHVHDTSCSCLESSKFVLLPRKANHDIALFDNAHTYRTLLSRCDPLTQSDALVPTYMRTGTSSVPSLPSQHEHVIGRRAEVHRSVGLLHRHRCVNIFGDAKCGKTSVSIASAHYLKERRVYRHGVYFLRMKEMRESHTSSTLDTMCATLGVDRSSVHSLEQLYRTIRYWECVLVLDGCDDASDALVARALLTSTYRPRLLLTSTQCVNLPVDDGFVTGLVLVGELPMQDALTLVAQLAPWMTQGDGVELVRSCGRSPYRIRVALTSLSRQDDPPLTVTPTPEPLCQQPTAMMPDTSYFYCVDEELP